MRLTGIKTLGRYRNTDSNKVVNVKRGRNLQRGTDLLFYLYRGKRVFITDRDFYGGVWKNVREK